MHLTHHKQDPRLPNGHEKGRYVGKTSAVQNKDVDLIKLIFSDLQP